MSVRPILVLLALRTGQFASALEIPDQYRAAANLADVPAGLLYAIALTESGRDVAGEFKPWPWTLNVNGVGRYFESREAQHRALIDALEETSSVDVGPLQINWRWHADRLGDPWDATEPLASILTGARILREQFDAQGGSASWSVAAGRYHRASPEPRHARKAAAYAHRVLDRWAQL